MRSEASRFAVILAGGEGSRFWPASRPERPKQLLSLAGPRPLIHDTVERATALVGADAVRVIAGPDLVDSLLEACPELDRDRFLVEPVARSTGPALAWAAFVLEELAPGALMISLHADHAIRPLPELTATVKRAIAAAEDGSLVCLGAVPDRPETGYGYIEKGEALGDRTWRAARFVEKPDSVTAAMYLDSGGFLWNTGIFVWRASAFLEAVSRLAPEIGSAMPHLERGDVEAFFREAAPLAVDVAVMERSDTVAVVEATFAWDDVGSWNAVARAREADSDGNVVVGPARLVEGADNVIWVEDADREVVLFAVHDLVVVQSGEKTLVTTREGSTRLKELLDRLREGDS